MTRLQTRRLRCSSAWLAAALSAVVASRAGAQSVEGGRIGLPDIGAFRVFLKDGTALASVGEIARVGDRVVFSLPLSTTRQPLASVSEREVDWTRTERYAEALRASRYAATRGEADFAAMSAVVARTLSDITITPGADAQLALAERARSMLARWPTEHYGYRAEEVRQTLALLDEVVGGLRAAAGQTRFDVNLVAATAPSPPIEPMLAPPTLQQSIEHALRLSALAPSAADRVLLLEEVRAVLADSAVTKADREWRAAAERRASSALELEQRIDRSYRELTTATLQRLDRRAANQDVQGLIRMRAQVLERDASLGQKRPDEIHALLASIDVRLDAVRRLRLAQDQWRVREPLVRAYREAVTPWLAQLRRAQATLTDIRALAGPSLERLSSFLTQLDKAAPFIQRVNVPDEARDAHAAAQSALQLARTAARTRQRAIAGNDMRLAWDASAAAAGALLFLERAEASAATLLRPPTP